MRKLVMFLSLCSIFLLVGCSCKKNDYMIAKMSGERYKLVYNNTNYFMHEEEDTSSFEMCDAAKHQVGRALIWKWFEPIYVRDDDIEENIIFSQRWFYVKEGFDFPTHSTPIKSFKIYDRSINSDNPIITEFNIENCSFEKMFTAIEENLVFSSVHYNTKFRLNLCYEDYIEGWTWIMSDNQNNLYMGKNNQHDICFYKINDDYVEILKCYMGFNQEQEY